MRKYAEQDFKNFSKDEQGHIICPTGVYTEIGIFPAKCEFGTDYIFGTISNKSCHFDADSGFERLKCIFN